MNKIYVSTIAVCSLSALIWAVAKPTTAQSLQFDTSKLSQPTANAYAINKDLHTVEQFKLSSRQFREIERFASNKPQNVFLHLSSNGSK